MKGRDIKAAYEWLPEGWFVDIDSDSELAPYLGASAEPEAVNAMEDDVDYGDLFFPWQGRGDMPTSVDVEGVRVRVSDDGLSASAVASALRKAQKMKGLAKLTVTLPVEAVDWLMELVASRGWHAKRG